MQSQKCKQVSAIYLLALFCLGVIILIAVYLHFDIEAWGSAVEMPDWEPVPLCHQMSKPQEQWNFLSAASVFFLCFIMEDLTT